MIKSRFKIMTKGKYKIAIFMRGEVRNTVFFKDKLNNTINYTSFRKFFKRRKTKTNKLNFILLFNCILKSEQ